MVRRVMLYMTNEEDQLNRLRKDRTARVKRILRWLPRRSNIHKYPILKWFSAGIRKRSYLWSFRCRQAIPAIYAGTILSLLPLFGIQLVLALMVAIVLRANLPLLFGLQFISNPFTILPICYASYNIGRLCLFLFGFHPTSMSMTEIAQIFQSIKTGHWMMSLEYFTKVYFITFLGALILGVFFATVGATLYRFSAMEIEISRRRLKDLKEKRMQKQP